jgi:hypothetical protein
MIEIVMDRDCPNVAQCRAALRAALVEAQLPRVWREWDRSAADTPPAYRQLGSPTILIDGRDVADVPGAAAPSGNSCRVYTDEENGGLQGVPSVRSIVDALRARPGVRPAT